MTREELRDYVDEQRTLGIIPYHVYSALIDGIDTLEQEPCEDAISRQALLKLMGEEPFNWTDSDKELQVVEDYRNFRNMVEQLPSVKPQEKTGHWIEHPEIETSTPEYLMFYECSECGDKQCFCKSDIHKKHFCNNCGARMVEPQESEE